MAESLVVEGLTVRYGALDAVRDVSLQFEEGVVAGVIGPNGAGKTTLLNAISGFTRIAAGSVKIGELDVTRASAQTRVRNGIVRSFQTVRLLEGESVFTNIALGCERFGQPSAMEQLLNLPRQWRVHRRDAAAVEDVAGMLGLSNVLSQSVRELPFASRRLTELARILVAPPRFLLLDEPAAGFDRADRLALGRHLRELQQRNGFCLIVVEHDVDVVRRLCSHVIALDSGRVIATGTPNDVLLDPLVQVAYFGTEKHA
jgi:branched-chain amino acid transport system ATP-binding protein